MLNMCPSLVKGFLFPPNKRVGIFIINEFNMGMIIKLTEGDLIKLIKRVLAEETNEASSPAQQAAIAINMKKKGIKPKNESLYEDEYGSVEEIDFDNDETLNEAEYQGRKVQLGKIMQGDIKKFKVYVKNDKGKVVKVNFGFGGKSAHGKRMTIKKNNPERRKSFRARHNCDNPGPRWKPRYWACRTW